MKELKEIASKYGTQKMNGLLSNFISQIYADGYRDGYKDREEEILIDLRDRTCFVDLGLSSGTLWSIDYVTENKSILYAPYIDSSVYSIPTKEQVHELFDECRWSLYEDGGRNKYCYLCIGPNGENIRFDFCGYMEIDTVSKAYWNVHFWIKSENSGNEKDFAHIRHWGATTVKDEKGIEKIFSGYRLPIRLVKQKQ